MAELGEVEGEYVHLGDRRVFNECFVGRTFACIIFLKELLDDRSGKEENGTSGIA